MSDITDKVSKLFAGYFDAIEKAANLFGVVSGCAVSDSATDMTVSVASGTIRKGNTTYSVTRGSLAIAAADATYDRYDTVVYDTSTSSLTVLTGTADADPVPPKPNSDQCLLAFVKVTAGSTNTSGAVIDYRMFVQGSIDADTVDGEDASAFEHVSNKGVANGYCDLDASALVPLARIPSTLTGKDADSVDGYEGADLEKVANKGVANGYCDLDSSALIPLARIPPTLTGKDADSVDGNHATDLVVKAETMYLVSNDIQIKDSTEESTTSLTYVKLKEFTLPSAFPSNATIRVYFELRPDGFNKTVYGRIYRNGTAVGTKRTARNTDYVGFTEDISGWNPGDTVQLYAKCEDSSVPAYVRNFQIRGKGVVKYDITLTG